MARKRFWDQHDDAFAGPRDFAALAGAPTDPKAATIGGTSARDTLNGTAGADTISGGEAGDTIRGSGGNDTLYGFGPSDRTGSGDLITATLVASELGRTVFAGSAPGDPNRMFVIEQDTGQINIVNLNNNTMLPTPFLDIDGIVSIGGEQGLLGMAFHPDYATNGKYYVFTNRASDGDIEVWQYTRGSNPDVSNTTRQLVIRIEHSSATNHNGGWMGFGPDGYLYLAVGDGGGSGDTNNDAQSLDTLLGKILRIDVNGDDFGGDASRNYAIPDDNPFVGVTGAAEEIFAYGLRNPWRMSFDPLTGDVYIGDVGQGEREEINFVPAGQLAGANFGWHVMEGTLVYDDDTPYNPPPNSPLFTDPIFDYPHDASGGFAVTGGYVIRGGGSGGQGLYIFADFGTDNIWTLSAHEGGYTNLVLRNSQIVVNGGDLDDIASFAVDGSGRLYAVGLDGDLHRLSFNAGAGDGADTINGGAGNDRLWGGRGADILIGGQGADRLNGGDGFDTARYTGSSVGVRVALNGSQGVGGDAAGDVLTGVEALVGSARNDQLTGSNGNNRLSGGNGADRLNGGLGNDFILGGGGADRLVGAGGQDALAGGAGADAFVFSAALTPGNADTIADFASVDVIQLAHSVFGGLVVGNLAAGAFRAGAAAQDANDRIIYNFFTGDLFFDVDGAGGQTQVRFATLSGAPALTAQDFVVI